MLRSSADLNEAMERAVGGNYEKTGTAQAKLIRKWAPGDRFYLIDIGCGSGRTANALKDGPHISYLGTDVVPDLLDYAKKTAGRQDWRFEQISSIEIPETSDMADIVIAMSVFTHLKPDEIKAYLREIVRVLKRGGVVIASYLDRYDKNHRERFYKPLRGRLYRIIGRDVMVSFTDKAELTAWFEEAGLVVKEALGSDPLGQHVLIGCKTA